jgi:hypothetical protein
MGAIRTKVESNESETSNRIYSPLPIFTDRSTIETILAIGSIDELQRLSLAVGEDFPDWKYAQDVCLQLAEHSDDNVRANACLGLGYIARIHQRLEKHLVKPVLLRELRCQTNGRGKIEDAIEDINFFLGWRLAHKHQDK